MRYFYRRIYNVRISDFIEKKRDGGEHTEEEIRCFITEMVNGNIPDYMISAWLMAAFIRGLNHSETVALTAAMAESGDTVDTSRIDGITADKHSTGGVGDKTSLIIAPIVSCAGIKVAKLSGRGLGITGGTVDKIASIPGCKVELSTDEFFTAVDKIGMCISAQSGNLAPADKILYALRDVTATIDSIPLIASSIMSKKLASGADCIVLDVKCGNGAFMRTEEKAAELAGVMVDIGKSNGRKMCALVTDMSTPLGLAAGNAPEVKEAIEVLSGKGPADTREICLEIAAQMMHLCGKGEPDTCRALAEEIIESGRARAKLAEFIAAIGGDPRVTEDTSLLPTAENAIEIKSTSDGYLQSVNAEMIGRAALVAGAGREKKSDAVDPAAGVILKCKAGDRVSAGDILCRIEANDKDKLARAEEFARAAFTVSDVPPEGKPLILRTVL